MTLFVGWNRFSTRLSLFRTVERHLWSSRIHTFQGSDMESNMTSVRSRLTRQRPSRSRPHERFNRSGGCARHTGYTGPKPHSSRLSSETVTDVSPRLVPDRRSETSPEQSGGTWVHGYPEPPGLCTKNRSQLWLRPKDLAGPMDRPGALLSL